MTIQEPLKPRVGGLKPWHYILPFAMFLLLTQAESYSVNQDGSINPRLYALIYSVKIVVVSLSLWISRAALKDLLPRPTFRLAFLAVILGGFVGLFWTFLDGVYPALPESVVGKRSAFDPSQLVLSEQIVFLVFRMTGLILLVPVIEELFIRDFVLRYVSNPEWETLSPWNFTLSGAVVSTVLFIAGHPEWLPALLCGVIWLWLLRYGKSLSAVVISHSVANLYLGIYSFVTWDWHFL